MSQPVVVASAPAPFLRRAFDWWLAQVKRALPPTIFFFVGFNLILWTKLLILGRGARHRVQPRARSANRFCWSADFRNFRRFAAPIAPARSLPRVDPLRYC
jgi:hypothetical protein